MGLNKEIKQNDTHDPLKVQLKRKTNDTTTPVDLSSADTVKLYMRKRDRKDLKIDGGSCTILNATEGKVQYDWTSSDVDEDGVFEAELEVVYPDGSNETWPEDENRIVITIYRSM